jgi:DNA-nicking Smr family endonuclease
VTASEEVPFEVPIGDTLDLHTFPPREVKPLVEEYLYQCVRRKFRFVRIIHGKGTGVQRQIVHSILEGSTLVEAYEEGPDWGSTSVRLRATPASDDDAETA